MANNRTKPVTVKNSSQLKLYTYFSPSLEEAKVFMWDACRIYSMEHTHGTDFSSLLDYIVSSGIDYFYIHDLEQYAPFIYSGLDALGWGVLQCTSSQACHMRYSSVINKTRKIYSITLYYCHNRDPRNYRQIIIFDSKKKVNLAETVIAETNTPDYLLRKYGDYLTTYPYEIDEMRPMTEADFLCAEFWSELLACIMQHMLSQGMNHVTLGADALALFTKFTRTKQFGKDFFKTAFPSLSREEEEFLRMAYRGGLVLCPEESRHRDVEGGIVIDVNQMYPYWASTAPLPWGRPVWYDGQYKQDDSYPLYFQMICVTGRLKGGYLPFINDLDSYALGDYGEDDLVDSVLVMTNFEMELLYESYNIDHINYVGGYKFRAFNPDDGPFKPFFEKYYNIKISTTGVEQLVAKLINNSLIGKFATMPYRGSYTVDVENGVSKLIYEDSSSGDPFSYVPLAACVTAMSRCYLCIRGHYNINRFLYCDTDSLHLEGTEPPEGVELDSKKLGAFKLEKVYKRARYLGRKTYIYSWDEDGKEKLKICCSGLTLSAKENITWENFNHGMVVDGNLRRQHVKGGSRIIPYAYKLPE